MTDQELSELIARHLEPAAMSANDYVQNWGPNRGTAYWRTRETDSMFQEYEWVPRDMVNDPAMTVMLMDKGAISVQVEPMKRYDDETKFCAYKVDTKIVVNLDNLGRAVAEAYAKAEGLTR